MSSARLTHNSSVVLKDTIVNNYFTLERELILH